MAFSIRKMLSNITYFKKPGEESPTHDPADEVKRRQSEQSTGEPSNNMSIIIEPDSTSKARATSLKIPESIKSFAGKKGSLSDTNLFQISLHSPSRKDRRKKKLRLDIKKANKSMSEALDVKSNENYEMDIENTPKHISLGCKSSEVFSERLKEFDFNKSFDIFDAMSEGRPSTPYEEENFDIESLSEHSESEVSIVSTVDDKNEIKMCRKVESIHNSTTSIEGNRQVCSATPESFTDVELDKTEDERINLLLSYQMKLEKMERFLKKLLTEFQFHIEVSKVFHCKSVVTALPGSDVSNLPKILGEITFIDNVNRGVSPTGSWNIIMEKEDTLTKFKLRNQLLSMKQFIEEFINVYLQNREMIREQEESTPEIISKTKKFLNRNHRSITFDICKENRKPKRLRISQKKRNRRFNDFPDFEEAMQKLFSLETEARGMDDSDHCANVTDISNYDENDAPKCVCKCRLHRSSTENSDSGLIKTEESLSQSISSSIGNFSLDSSTLTAYSESLDQIISYSSFQDTSIFSSLLQKAAIERITFYVQVHSIQLKCEQSDSEFESKNIIIFFCPACNVSENEEHGLLKHILSQKHCEKIHFLYKTAYIKKCFAAGKEIQPSSVLNSMTYYRDDNKIVCFGDAVFACSLCFENSIVGESVLMAHCSDADHAEMREKLSEILD